MIEILEKAIANKEKEIEELQEENPYYISEELEKKGYTVGTTEIYAQDPNYETCYLKLGGKDEKKL